MKRSPLSRWDRRRLVVAVIAALTTVVIGLALSGSSRGIALYAYLLLLTLIAAVTIGARIRRAWPPTPRFDRLVPRPSEAETRVLQLEALSGRLAGGRPSALDVHQRIRPLVTTIVAAQLARSYGIDLERRPDRAEQLVGPRTWELIRPGVEAPRDAWGPTWSTAELDELVSELERAR